MFYVLSSRPSKGARALAKALRGKRVQQFPSLKPGDTVINWGDGSCNLSQSLNSGQSIRQMSNKRLAFGVFSSAGVPIPAYAVDKVGVTWKGLTVVRHKLTGHSGEGIELVEDPANLPPAPLYVQYVKKEQEFRVHVGKLANGDFKIIAVQRKARRHDFADSDVNWKVRNHANGFVFAREGVNPPLSVTSAATHALGCSGLDFGAVDVILNGKEGKAYVLEINTAPGLEGTTISDYAAFFKNYA